MTTKMLVKTLVLTALAVGLVAAAAHSALLVLVLQSVGIAAIVVFVGRIL